jgi:hypothetical protein
MRFLKWPQTHTDTHKYSIRAAGGLEEHCALGALCLRSSPAGFEFQGSVSGVKQEIEIQELDFVQRQS